MNEVIEADRENDEPTISTNDEGDIILTYRNGKETVIEYGSPIQILFTENQTLWEENKTLRIELEESRKGQDELSTQINTQVNTINEEKRWFKKYGCWAVITLSIMFSIHTNMNEKECPKTVCECPTPICRPSRCPALLQLKPRISTANWKTQDWKTRNRKDANQWRNTTSIITGLLKEKEWNIDTPLEKEAPEPTAWIQDPMKPPEEPMCNPTEPLNRTMDRQPFNNKVEPPSLPEEPETPVHKTEYKPIFPRLNSDAFNIVVGIGTVASVIIYHILKRGFRPSLVAGSSDAPPDGPSETPSLAESPSPLSPPKVDVDEQLTFITVVSAGGMFEYAVSVVAGLFASWGT